MLKTDKYLNYCDLVSFGWSTVISNIGFFIKVGIVCIAVWAVFAIPTFFIENTATDSKGNILPGYIVPYIAIQILVAFFSLIMTIGWMRIALSFCSERKPAVGMLFNFRDCIFKYVAVSSLYLLIIIGGTLLFIVPGIIWYIKFSLCQYFVIDKGLGPIDALKASARATEGMKWHWLGLMMVASLIMATGMMVLFAGMIIAYPIAFIAIALGYRQLAAQTPKLAEFGIAAIPADKD